MTTHDHNESRLEAPQNAAEDLFPVNDDDDTNAEFIFTWDVMQLPRFIPSQIFKDLLDEALEGDALVTSPRSPYRYSEELLRQRAEGALKRHRHLRSSITIAIE